MIVKYKMHLNIGLAIGIPIYSHKFCFRFLRFETRLAFLVGGLPVREQCGATGLFVECKQRHKCCNRHS